MDRNIEVLKHCPHFYTIINFEYYSDDIISEKLIDIYEKYIFSSDLDNRITIQKVEKLDEVMYKYISDYLFRKQIKEDIRTIKIQKGGNILDSIVNAIIKMFENYEKKYTKSIPVTRWI